jgi:hypothetical protein
MYLYSAKHNFSSETDNECNNIMPDENIDMELAQLLIEYVLNILVQVVVAAPAPLVVPTSCIPHNVDSYIHNW